MVSAYLKILIPQKLNLCVRLKFHRASRFPFTLHASHVNWKMVRGILFEYVPYDLPHEWSVNWESVFTFCWYVNWEGWMIIRKMLQWGVCCEQDYCQWNIASWSPDCRRKKIELTINTKYSDDSLPASWIQYNQTVRYRYILFVYMVSSVFFRLQCRLSIFWV